MYPFVSSNRRATNWQHYFVAGNMLLVIIIEFNSGTIKIELDNTM